MSEGQSHAPERNAAASGTHIADSKREFVRGRWIVRCGGVALFRLFLSHAGLSALICGLDGIRGFLRGLPHSVFSRREAYRTPAGRGVCVVLSPRLSLLPAQPASLCSVCLPFRDALPLSSAVCAPCFLVLAAMMVGVVAETRYLGHPFATAEEHPLLLRDRWAQQFCLRPAVTNQFSSGACKFRDRTSVPGSGARAHRARSARSSWPYLNRYYGEARSRPAAPVPRLGPRPERDRGSGADCSECPRRGEGSRVRLPRRRT